MDIGNDSLNTDKTPRTKVTKIRFIKDPSNFTMPQLPQKLIHLGVKKGKPLHQIASIDMSRNNFLYAFSKRVSKKKISQWFCLMVEDSCCTFALSFFVVINSSF